jgi:hypothetical protein
MPGRQIRLLVLVLPSFFLAPPGSVSVRDQQWKFPRVRRAAKDKDEVLSLNSEVGGGFIGIP